MSTPPQVNNINYYVPIKKVHTSYLSQMDLGGIILIIIFLSI